MSARWWQWLRNT